MYQRIETTDHVTVMNKALYDNLQDGIDELRDSFGLSDESKVYNSSYLYKSGDLCIHDNKIYRCKENMSENTEIPHEWVSSEWEETSITDELTLVKSDIKDELESVKSTIEEQSGGVKLGIDAEGNPGYVVTGEDGADTVIPFSTELKPLLIHYSDGNGTLGNSDKFAVYANSAGYGETSLSWFKNLSLGNLTVYGLPARTTNKSTEYVEFYYPKPWIFMGIKWFNTSQYGYGVTGLNFFEASYDGETWIDEMENVECSFQGSNGNGGYIIYKGTNFYKYWKFGFNGSHNASNITPSLMIALYKP